MPFLLLWKLGEIFTFHRRLLRRSVVARLCDIWAASGMLLRSTTEFGGTLTWIRCKEILAQRPSWLYHFRRIVCARFHGVLYFLSKLCILFVFFIKLKFFENELSVVFATHSLQSREKRRELVYGLCVIWSWEFSVAKHTKTAYYSLERRMRHDINGAGEFFLFGSHKKSLRWWMRKMSERQNGWWLRSIIICIISIHELWHYSPGEPGSASSSLFIKHKRDLAWLTHANERSLVVANDRSALTRS